MKKMFVVFCLTFLASAMASPVHAQSVKQEERKLPDFTIVDFGIAADVYLSQGPASKFIIEGNPDILKEIETTVSGKSLKVRYRGISFNAGRNKITIHITMPEIEGLTISGSARLEAKTPLTTNAVNFLISGSGRIRIPELDVSQIKTRISGSGSIEILAGKTLSMTDISISGSGSYNASGIRTTKAVVNISGSGNSRIHATNELEAHVSGSGVVYYSGNPIVNARISGSGKVLKAK